MSFMFDDVTLCDVCAHVTRVYSPLPFPRVSDHDVMYIFFWSLTSTKTSLGRVRRTEATTHQIQNSHLTGVMVILSLFFQVSFSSSALTGKHRL